MRYRLKYLTIVGVLAIDFANLASAESADILDQLTRKSEMCQQPSAFQQLIEIFDPSVITHHPYCNRQVIRAAILKNSIDRDYSTLKTDDLEFRESVIILENAVSDRREKHRFSDLQYRVMTKDARNPQPRIDSVRGYQTLGRDQR